MRQIAATSYAAAAMAFCSFYFHFQIAGSFAMRLARFSFFQPREASARYFFLICRRYSFLTYADMMFLSFFVMRGLYALFCHDALRAMFDDASFSSAISCLRAFSLSFRADASAAIAFFAACDAAAFAAEIRRAILLFSLIIFAAYGFSFM